MSRLKLLVFVQTAAIAAMLVGGCAASSSSSSFPRYAARTIFDVYYGEVVSTRPVQIEGQPSALGRLGGAAIGFAIGVGNSPHAGPRRVRAAVGSVAGSAAGEVVERRARTEAGLEVVIRLDHDETIAVVQDDDVELSAGQRVQVLMGRDGSSRVQPL